MGFPHTPKDTMSVTVVEGERDTDKCPAHHGKRRTVSGATYPSSLSSEAWDVAVSLLCLRR
jgi:hypothetical protein